MIWKAKENVCKCKTRNKTMHLRFNLCCENVNEIAYIDAYIPFIFLVFSRFLFSLFESHNIFFFGSKRIRSKSCYCYLRFLYSFFRQKSSEKDSSSSCAAQRSIKWMGSKREKKRKLHDFAFWQGENKNINTKCILHCILSTNCFSAIINLPLGFIALLFSLLFCRHLIEVGWAQESSSSRHSKPPRFKDSFSLSVSIFSDAAAIVQKPNAILTRLDSNFEKKIDYREILSSDCIA